MTAADAKQYPGWPIVIDQEDNYGRKAVAYLPTIRVTGQSNPVVQVIDESNGEIVYTLRINGRTFRPKVFKPGKYTVKVGEGKRVKTLKGISSLGADESKTIEIEL